MQPQFQPQIQLPVAGQVPENSQMEEGNENVNANANGPNVIGNAEDQVSAMPSGQVSPQKYSIAQQHKNRRNKRSAMMSAATAETVQLATGS